MIDYTVDEKRYSEMIKNGINTGLFIRAKMDGKWDSYDVFCLTKESLLDWLRSRGQENTWAENVVGILLGHGNIC